ncbi:MAG: uroporphyrinogen decarboxylase family protein [Clostridiaceae bacterium]|nr:uroporphyrinogen decarboxylase family protein [Clostridiaceae bacterium]
MAYRGVMDDVRKCIKLQKPSRVPVFALSEEFDVRMAGEIYSEYNSNSKIMAKCQIEAIKKYDYDWAWLQVDDCIEFETLGVGVRGAGNILPATCRYLPATYETLKSLKMPDPKKDGRMPVLLDAIKRIKDELGDTVCVTGRTAAPFSSVTLLYGMAETMMLMYDQPELVMDTVKFFIDLQSMWGCAQIEAGADALWVGDCNASGHLISVDQYKEFAYEGVKKCVQAYNSAGGFSFYHASEHRTEHMKVQADTGISAISVGPGVDIETVKKAVGDKVCIMGNVDPIRVLLQSGPEVVYEESRRIMEIGKQNGGYIFSSGEMIPRDVPEENMMSFIKAGKKYGKY